MFLQKYLLGLLCWNAFIVSVYTNGSGKGNDTCVQKTVENHCCKLPFVYEGKTYNACTKDYDSVIWGLFHGYFWCFIDDGYTMYKKCKEPIVSLTQPTIKPIVSHTQPTPTTKPDKEETTRFQSSSMFNVRVTSVLVRVIPSHKASRFSTSSSSHSISAGLSRGRRKKASSKRTKQNMYNVLACGIGGAIFVVMVVALTVAIYLKRKRKMKKEEGKESEHDMKSYRSTDETNNPLYESADKDLDIKSNEEGQALTDKANNHVYECADKNPNIKDNEEKQALHPSHVYHELEDPQKPTSCTHEYSIPYEASMSISDGPKITPALNDSDSLTHFNELYETPEMEI